MKLVADLLPSDPRAERFAPSAAERAWTLTRACSDLPSAPLAIEDESGRLVAGLCVAFRRVRRGAEDLRVAVLAGPWSAPEARGRGTFELLLDAAISRAEEEEAAALLAVMTEHNPNRRKLEARGATLAPASYAAAAPEATAAEEAPVTELEGGDDALYDAILRSREGRTALHYETPADLRGQMLARPRPSRACSAAGVPAIVEVRGGENHVLALGAGDDASRDRAIRALATAAAATGQRLALFSSGEGSRAAIEAAGLRVTRGVVAAIGCGGAPLDPRDLFLEAGDLP